MRQFEEIASTFPRLSIVQRTEHLPRCRRCASVLLTKHIACDDGALIPVVYCPVCSNPPKSQPRPVSKLPRSNDDIIVDYGLAANDRRSLTAVLMVTDD
jgi:hypothetical protein